MMAENLYVFFSSVFNQVFQFIRIQSRLTEINVCHVHEFGQCVVACVNEFMA